VYEERDGTYIVASARGPSSDWLRNIQANPNVHVRIGSRRFDAFAEIIIDPARIADYLQRQLDRNPKMFATILRLEDLPSRPTRDELERLALKRPMVAIYPTQRPAQPMDSA
jgi:deazaflavin-dependent oxidoreductase (nitroreductase family)